MERVCAVCGVSESQAKLQRALNGKEIVFACPKCIEMEELIVIRKPTEEQMSYANKPYTVRERLAKAMGNSQVEKPKPAPIPTQSLYCISPYRKTDFPIKLVDNFHWKIMMARKAKKMSQEALAMRIGEPIEAVKTLESGCIGRDSEKILAKIENVFGISLMGNQPPQQPQTSSQQSEVPQIRDSTGKILVTKENIRTLKVQDLIRVREEMAQKKKEGKLPVENLTAEEEVVEIEEFSEEK